MHIEVTYPEPLLALLPSLRFTNFCNFSQTWNSTTPWLWRSTWWMLMKFHFLISLYNVLFHRHVMRITNDAETLPYQYLYFKASEVYLGDKRSAYGQKFTFSLSQHIPEGVTYTPYATSNLGDVIIEGNYTTFKLVASLPTQPQESKTEYTVSCWIKFYLNHN